MTSTTTTPALAKARLLSVALHAAARANLSPMAHAVLAHLIADSWPHDDGWAARTPTLTLASRLGVHAGTVKRALRELTTAALLERRAGIGRSASSSVIRVPTGSAGAPSESAQAHPQRERRRTLRECAGAPSEGAQAHPLSDSQVLPAATAGAAAAEAQRVGYFTARPYWLPEGKPWIDELTARELARLPLTLEIVQRTYSAAKSSRATLTNPAGFIVSRLRAACQEAR